MVNVQFKARMIFGATSPIRTFEIFAPHDQKSCLQIDMELGCLLLLSMGGQITTGQS